MTPENIHFCGRTLSGYFYQEYLQQNESALRKHN